MRSTRRAWAATRGSWVTRTSVRPPAFSRSSRATISSPDRALELVGLTERADHFPAQLSGGEQQRVAIARAVANAPRILLADEPTGNLDPRTSEHVFSALTQLVQASGLAVVVATHNMEIAGRMDRRVTLRDGLVIELE